MMRIGCLDGCSCLTSCWNTVKYSLSVAVFDLKQIASSPDALQKACILVHSIIQGINLTYETNYLPRLVKVLDHSQTLDFYGFCRLPHYLLHAYCHEQIEDSLLLENLTAVLHENWRFNEGNLPTQNFARHSLKAFLELMAEEEIAFSTEEKMREALEIWLINRSEGIPPDVDPLNIDLARLRIPLKKTNWLIALTDAAFIIADILCIPDFLNQWRLIHLPSFKQVQHRFPLASHSPFRTLDNYVRASMSIGFALQFIQSIITLMESNTNPEERSHAKWILVASAAEFIYNTSILRKASPRFITFFAFWAKLLGLIAFLKTPKPAFLE
jgi:hypothetical protein